MGKPTFDLCCSEEARCSDEARLHRLNLDKATGRLVRGQVLARGSGKREGAVFGPTEITRRDLFLEFIGE